MSRIVWHPSGRGAATAALVGALAALAAGCDGGGSGRIGALAAPTDVEAVSVTAEPGTVSPQLLPGIACAEFPAFRASLSITVRARRGITIRGIGFELVDGAGGRAVPIPIPGSSTAASIPATGPLPLPSSGPLPTPTTPPVPIPGVTASAPGAPVPRGGAALLPFTLQFGCGVPASGQLFVGVEAVGGDGSVHVGRTSVRVAG